MTTIPTDSEIDRVMHDTGMDRMQAINHLRQRATIRRRLPQPGGAAAMSASRFPEAAAARLARQADAGGADMARAAAHYSLQAIRHLQARDELLRRRNRRTK